MCTGHDSSSEHPADDQRPSGGKKEGKKRKGERPEGGNSGGGGAEDDWRGKNREITALFTPQEKKTSHFLQQNHQEGTERKWR